MGMDHEQGVEEAWPFQAGHHHACYLVAQVDTCVHT